jgi:cytochrome c oxidase subunit 2
MVHRPAGSRARRAAVFALAAAALAGCRGGLEYAQTTFHPVSEYGAIQNSVFYNTFWWTMGILAVVLVLLLYAVVRFRERPGAPHPKQIHGNTKLELIWTIIPAIIVVFIGVPTVQAIFATQQPPSEDAIVIEVIGHQWWWEFNYPQYGVNTANLFYLPVGREIHFEIRSNDVVHSFWIPRFGGKRDVLPVARTRAGERPRHNHIVLTVDEPGTYAGQCGEFCGESHAIMAKTAVAVSEAEFEAWIETMRHSPPAPPDATAPPPAGAADDDEAAAGGSAAAPGGQPDPLAEEGKRIFLGKTCVACHAISGTTAVGRIGPNLTRYALRPTVGAGARPNTRENLEAWLRHPRGLKPGARMPGVQDTAGGFPATGLTDHEVRAIAAYLLSLN